MGAETRQRHKNSAQRKGTRIILRCNTIQVQKKIGNVSTNTDILKKRLKKPNELIGTEGDTNALIKLKQVRTQGHCLPYPLLLLRQ